MKFRKLLKLNLIFSGIFISGLLSGCDLSSSGSSTNDELSGNADGNKKITQPYDNGYKYGRKNCGTLSLSYDLLSEYKTWRDRYVVRDGAGNYKRVRRDVTNNYDTVSEGIGYGMLLAVYFDDKPTFDDLYCYMALHLISSGNLMHWKVDRYGNNVSEFADYPITVPNAYRDSVPDLLCATSATLPHGVVYKSKSGSDIIILKTYNQWVNINPGRTKDDYANAQKFFESNHPDYYQFSGQERSVGSATDADEDICAALCIASYKWPGRTNTYNYKDEAIKFIKDFWKLDINWISDSSGNHAFIKNGSLWGGKDGWNPSYYSPAWYRLFKKFVPNNTNISWDNLIVTMDAEMGKVSTRTRDYIVNNCGPVVGSAGLFPDWCDTSGKPQNITLSSGRVITACSDPVKPATNSDRSYLMDNGTIAGRISFNSYYDAVRVPWRLAVDYSWNGYNNESYAALYRIFNFVKNTGIDNIVDGYFPDGTPWRSDYKDGFNPGAGGNPGAVTFYAMYATTSLVSNKIEDYDFVENCFKTVRDKKETNSPETGACYYGDALRMLSLLYLSGKFVDYSDTTSYSAEYVPSGTTVRIQNKWFSSSYINIENRIQHQIEIGSIQNGWSSAQWYIAKNNEGYYTFKSKWYAQDGTDCYLHVEEQLNTVEWDRPTTGGNAGVVPNPGWWSAEWIMVQTDRSGYFHIKNRWTGKSINANYRTSASEMVSDPLQYGDTALWKIVPVN
jgi:hypothetical protein